jgi:hypothetical protein
MTNQGGHNYQQGFRRDLFYKQMSAHPPPSSNRSLPYTIRVHIPPTILIPRSKQRKKRQITIFIITCTVGSFMLLNVFANSSGAGRWLWRCRCSCRHRSRCRQFHLRRFRRHCTPSSLSLYSRRSSCHLPPPHPARSPSNNKSKSKNNLLRPKYSVMVYNDFT